MLSNLPTNLRFRTFVDRVPWESRTLIIYAAPESVKCPISRGFKAPTQKLAVTAVGIVVVLMVSFSSLSSSRVDQHSDYSATQDATEAASQNDPTQFNAASSVSASLTCIAGLNTYFAQELELRKVTGEADRKTLLEILS